MNEADRPLVNLAADAALRKCFKRRLAATPRSTPTSQATSGRTSAFDRLGHQTLAPQEEDEWVPQPEMTPRKVDWGRQPNREQEPAQAPSQKRQSQSRPRDEVDPKKGWTEGDGKAGKVQVGIDWANMGIRKPISKLDSWHPSSKSDTSGASGDLPWMKSTVAKQKHGSSGSQDRTGSQEGRGSRTSSTGPSKQLGDPEKRELQEKPHWWIEARVKHLDLAGYMEEINSMRYFGRNAGSFALEIVAIADWGRRFIDKGLNYPIPTFPQYLFTPLPDLCQGRVQVPVKPSQLSLPGGDVRNRSSEAWKWLVAVLQFWGDEVSITDGMVYGGHVCPISALAEYVFNAINLGLEPRSRITWDDVVIQTPWMTKRLHSMTAGQEKTVQRQALPEPGVSSELEVTLERRFSEHVLNSSIGRGKVPIGKPSTPGTKPISSPPRLTKAGWGDVLKLHLKKATQGEGWTHIEPKDPGPDVGRLYQTPKEAAKLQENVGAVQPSHSPLTSELFGLEEELIGELDYEDVEETNLGPDPEIAQAVAHIPKADNWADVEMQKSNSPPGFEPEVSRSGYDVNLVHADPTRPGSASPVMAGEDQMLDEEVQSRAPGASRPGNDENPDCTADN